MLPPVQLLQHHLHRRPLRNRHRLFEHKNRPVRLPLLRVNPPRRIRIPIDRLIDLPPRLVEVRHRPTYPHVFPPIRTRTSERCKFPFSARPGPFAGSEGSVKTSTWNPVIRPKFNTPVIEYVSVGGAFP